MLYILAIYLLAVRTFIPVFNCFGVDSWLIFFLCQLVQCVAFELLLNIFLLEDKLICGCFESANGVVMAVGSAPNEFGQRGS